MCNLAPAPYLCVTTIAQLRRIYVYRLENVVLYGSNWVILFSLSLIRILDNWVVLTYIYVFLWPVVARSFHSVNS